MTEKTVYFLRPIGQAGPIKIGCSKEPMKRLRSVEIWSPLMLEVVAAVPGGHADESVLHQMFGDNRLHGEWFDITPELQSVLDYVAKAGRLPPLDYTLRTYEAKRKNPQARSKMTRRADPKLRREKWQITVAIHKAERRVYGFVGHEFMRPVEIETIVSEYRGFDCSMPSNAEFELIRDYIGKLNAMPAADRSYKSWLDWHHAVPKQAAAA